ncbi:hypothetical protein ATX62_01025 [Oenococcus oeni]|uniref:Uncharacterized protein n=1 Tax=Oenococcus oeni TaxID=1247 RepID=A0A6N4A973_OENOE|nr:hypothetical protein [Oenococcus oeni]AVI93509.1 hypothetical protein AX764_00915 [Oenococcus oeni]KGI01808.1 hypothetical protein X293_05045 [Oenococcus oeni IOEB_C52]OIK57839.1 hypothetical protein ATW61_01080 [Oenococcus oeni]OIK88530.1 hypothetical protein ATW79_01170 [Oenococcus oeni]OIL10587.1 hypothetical protein ATW92_01105 [Oenococcus oeni]
MYKFSIGIFALTGTFGISAHAAKAVYPIIYAAFGSGSLTIGRSVALIAATGAGALIAAAIIGAGGIFISRKLRAGRGATLAW